MRILFSPIGLTDPISKNYDGAMLHISRRYSPEIIYMYLSEDMQEKQNKDQRYTKVIEYLDELLGTNTEIVRLDGSKIDSVYKFDLYYEEFEKYLKQIKNDYPDAEILLNTSSGTPAMKSALQVIAALGEGNYKAIQVPAPNKVNHEPPEIPVDVLWEENKDNEKGYKDRTEVSTHLQLITKFKKEIIKKHIDQYDYHAAFEVAKDIKHSISKEALKGIEAAKERLSLNYLAYAELFKEAGADVEKFELDEYFKNETKDIKLYEYILSLDVKVKREEYADFVRGISPLLRDIFRIYLERKLKINILRYCDNYSEEARISLEKIDSEINNKTKYMNEAKVIKEALNKEFNNKFRYGSAIAASNLLVIIAAFETNNQILDILKTLRRLERNVRNIAAHQIVSINDEKIKEGSSSHGKNGKSSKQIIQMLKIITQHAKINKVGNWNSYQEMNEYIKGLI